LTLTYPRHQDNRQAALEKGRAGLDFYFQRLVPIIGDL
jgi:hypothetical protein